MDRTKHELWKDLWIAFVALLKSFRTERTYTPAPHYRGRTGNIVFAVACVGIAALAVGLVVSDIRSTNAAIAQASTYDSTFGFSLGNEDDSYGDSRRTQQVANTTVIQTAATGTVVDKQKAVTDYMVGMGWETSQLRFDNFMPNPSERGDTSFSQGVIDTRDELKAFMLSQDERARTARADLKAHLTQVEYERSVNAEAQVLVQVTDTGYYEGNSYFTGEGSQFYTTPRKVAAGDMLWVHVSLSGEVIEEGNIRADCGNPRATRLVPRVTVPAKVILKQHVNITVIVKITVKVPPPVIPPLPRFFPVCDTNTVPPSLKIVPESELNTPGYTTDLSKCTPEVPEIEYVPVCDTSVTPPVLRTVPKSEANKPGYTTDLTKCIPVTPPVKYTFVCDTTQNPPAIITVSEADANKPGYEPVTSPKCKPEPPKEMCPNKPHLPKDHPDCKPEPPKCPYNPDLPVGHEDCKPEPPKCPHNPDLPQGHPDCKPPVTEEPCPYNPALPKHSPECVKPPGDPDSGPSTPTPGAGNPEPQPTPGHEPGEGEAIDESTGTAPADPHEPSTDGSQTPAMPGDETVTPDEQPSAPDTPAPANPEHDGSTAPTNPDTGWTDPVDGDTSEEEMPIGDVGGDMELPNVP